MKKEYLKPTIVIREIELNADYAQFYSYHEGCATPQTKHRDIDKEKSLREFENEWGNIF